MKWYSDKRRINVKERKKTISDNKTVNNGLLTFFPGPV